MRRRDAKIRDTIHRHSARCWPTAIALLLAVGVHATVLATVAGLHLGTLAAPTLIRVSFLSGGHGGAAADAEASPEAAPRAAAVSGPPQAVPHRPRRLAAKARRRALRAPEPQIAPVVAEHAAERSAATDSAGPGSGEPNGSGPTERDGKGAGGGDGFADGGGPDQRASCLYCPQPYYPLIARARGWQGSVEVSLSVRSDGSVDGATLWRSSGHSALDQAAITAARHSRFRSPGGATPLRGRVEYRFELVKSTGQGRSNE